MESYFERARASMVVRRKLVLIIWNVYLCCTKIQWLWSPRHNKQSLIMKRIILSSCGSRPCQIKSFLQEISKNLKFFFVAKWFKFKIKVIASLQGSASLSNDPFCDNFMMPLPAFLMSRTDVSEMEDHDHDHNRLTFLCKCQHF